MFCYSNNGLSMRAVAADYVAQTGEVIFPSYATTQQLTNAFAGYAPAIAAQNAAAEAQAALTAGVNITSTSLPALNGTYAVAQSSLVDLSGVFAYCAAKNAFPGGTSTMTWYDAANVGHTFSSVSEFMTFAEAICTYVAQVQEWALAGGAGSIPSNNITIT